MTDREHWAYCAICRWFGKVPMPDSDGDYFAECGSGHPNPTLVSPDVVEAIKAEGRAEAWAALDAMQEDERRLPPDERIGDGVLTTLEAAKELVAEPNPLAQRDARVQLGVVEDLASWLGVSPDETDTHWQDSYEDARNALLDRVENRYALKQRDARVRRETLEEAAISLESGKVTNDEGEHIVLPNGVLHADEACEWLRALAQNTHSQ